MLRLRLEVVHSENLSDICIQATRIATQLGIEVVFKHDEQDFTAKPGMSAESCLNELLNKYEMPAAIPGESAGLKEAVKGKEPKAEKPAGGKTSKGGKSKPNEPADENTTSATAPEAEVQKEGV